MARKTRQYPVRFEEKTFNDLTDIGTKENDDVSKLIRRFVKDGIKAYYERNPKKNVQDSL